MGAEKHTPDAQFYSSGDVRSRGRALHIACVTFFAVLARKWRLKITHAMCNFDGSGGLIGGDNLVGICGFVMFGWFQGSRGDGTLGIHKGCPYGGCGRLADDVW